MQMVDDTISPIMDAKCSSVKVSPIRASNKHVEEVSVAVADLSHTNADTEGVLTMLQDEVFVRSTGVNPLDAKVSTTMDPNVHQRL